MVGSTLGALPAEDFCPHLSKLGRLLEWVEQHHSVEIVSVHCNLGMGHCYKRPLRKWALLLMAAR